jgi:serine/threonine protein kinase/tetratricopeptide (TPR) repeat protein
MPHEPMHQQLAEACAIMRRQLRADAPCRAEDLLAAYPAVAAHTDAALELIYTEFVLRNELGQEANRADWLARFPQWRDDLAELFEVHTVLAAGATRMTGATAAPAPAAGSAPGMVIGPYRLLDQIGEGGFGVVYLAEQQQPVRRKVALKILKPGMDTRQVVARFEAERQALALMDHPNIAQVHDGGQSASGRPYFVMELVCGIPITAFCDQAKLSIRARLELFVTVCQAVQHAHQKAIIHRDLKPSNVMVTWHDDKPVVKIIDFGIAKATGHPLTDKTLLTHDAEMIGTPLYMSPEQAQLGSLDVDTRSDIYSLGVLLYELLTGTTPFDPVRLQEGGVDELRRMIREEEPPRPSTRLRRDEEGGMRDETKKGQRTISAWLLSLIAHPSSLVSFLLPAPSSLRELDWIVMKCLEKDRNRRYDAASGLARDIDRYLHDEPVHACPPSAWYRARKFARRYRARLALAALMLFFLAILGGGVGWVARDEATRQAVTAAEVDRALGEAQAFCRRDRLPEAWEALKRADALLAGAGTGAAEELSRRVDHVRGGLQMADRLQAIRLDMAAVKDDHFDTAAADRHYREAFQSYGLDITALDPDQAAQRLEASEIKEQLVAALDSWLIACSAGRRGDERLLQLLRLADADPWRNQLRAAVQRRDNKTLKDLGRQVNVPGEPPATVVLLAQALDWAGESPMAIAILRSAQPRHTNDFWVNHNLAVYLMEAQPPQAAAAVEYYRAALALHSGSPGVYLNLGNALFRLERLDEAASAYRQAIHLKADYAVAHANLGMTLSRQGAVDEGISALKTAIHLRSDLALFHNALGSALGKQGLRDEAIAAHRNAVRLGPRLADMHRNLALALRSKGLLEEARIAMNDAIKLAPKDAQALSDLGSILNQLGRPDQAIPVLHKALDLNPDLGLAHYNLGNALRMKGLSDNAVAAYRQAVRFVNEQQYANACAGAHGSLGQLHGAAGNWEEALAAYRQAARLLPDSAQSHYDIGRCLAKLGAHEEAAAAYRRALHFDPGIPEAHCNLGQMLRHMGRFAEALPSLRRGDELGKKQPKWSQPSARWVRDCERLIELERQLPAVATGEIVPADAARRRELAFVCAMKQRNHLAARLYQEAFAARPELAQNVQSWPRFYAARAAALAGCGQGEDAGALTPQERAQWRRQALDWLWADLVLWAKLLETNTPTARAAVLQMLLRWQHDRDLAGVRGVADLAQWPETEQAAWRHLWVEVERIAARARGPARPAAKSKPAA